MDYEKLSRQMSYMLRHVPWKYGLELDPSDWVKVDELIEALHNQTPFKNAACDDFGHIMVNSEKQRFEMDGDRIRAAYGHSVPRKIEMVPAEPPDILYHGTARRFVDSIMTGGLSPRNRQYVHLSQDRETAAAVGRRRDEKPAILMVAARTAWSQGHKFYRVDETIWLADDVPPEFLRQG